MNNINFVKTMENIRSYKDIKQVASQKKYAKYAAKPDFKDRFPFLKELLAVKMEKTEIKINKPV